VPHSTVHPRRHMTGPGRYITLTTCTPEFTSAYRLVVWGGLAAAEPR
ncbi:class E sortase, partial [Streptomyces sp. PA03-6a]|nr:class E sortase [Streptomyces sp. PA03-6a]